MATNLISGLASGIDWKTMVDQLISVDHQRVDLITNKQKADQSKLTEWQGVNNKLLALKTAVTNLKTTAAFGLYKATMTTDKSSVQGSDLLAVTASASASAGSYTIKVNDLASAQKRSSGTIASLTTTLGSGYAGNLVINGTVITIDAADTLVSVREKINNANGGDGPTGVTAGIVSYSATDNRLILTSDTKGAAGFTLTGDANPLTSFAFQLTAGTDASLTVNNVPVTRTDNTITDLIPGVTLNLLTSDPTTTITLNVARDSDAIVSKINALVTSYNNLSSYINTQFSYDDTKKQTGGLLFGDGTLSSIKSSLTSVLTESIWGVASSYSTLGLVGISVDKYGQLSLDKTKLTGLLSTNSNDILKLFAANGTASNGAIEYIGHQSNTKPGDYSVNITTAATRSVSALSDSSTTLSGDETLTITAGSNVATVNLTSGMTLAEIISAVNDELDTPYAQSLASAEKLYSDAGHTTAITSATKWNSLYDSGGNLASLGSGDSISFSGTTRTGTAVSGVYTITDAASDSVQGLIGAVETAFANTVTASINSSGQLVVTDKTAGTSKTALSLTCNQADQAHVLDFGSLLATNTGGQTGRYAMAITAAAEGDQIMLRSDEYGSGHDFTITQLNKKLWVGSDPTVTGGKDVAGEINGEKATGTGQMLKGNTGDANVEGLTIRYTGTATGAVGSLKLTLGVAELFDRALFTMTDTVDGYVTFKQQSLQNEIDHYGTQITAMEDRLARKKDMLLAQYAAMETALQKIQSQSAWLTAQTQAAVNGWYKSSSS